MYGYKQNEYLERNGEIYSILNVKISLLTEARLISP